MKKSQIVFNSMMFLFAIVVLIALPAQGQIVQSGNIIIDMSEVDKGVSPKVSPGSDMEILVNGGFETGSFDPWYHDGAWTTSTNSPHTGTYCAYDIGNHWVRQDFAPIPASEITSVTLWERQPEAQISAIDFFYSNLPYSEDVIFVTANWAQYNATSFIEPGGIVTGIRIWGYTGGGPAQDETFIDDISLQSVGVPRVDIELTIPVPWIEIPPEGGTFSYTVIITNLETGTSTFDAWTMATLILPDTVTYGPFLQRTLTLAGSAVLTRELSQYVPAVAPDGVYYYYGKVGDYPNTVVDLDSFMVHKGVYVEGTKMGNGTWDVTGWDECEQTAIEKPVNFNLQTPHPNPFNNSTILRFHLGTEGEIALKVYDIQGRLVETILEGYQSAGEYEVNWNGENGPSGIYFFRLSSPGQVAVVKGMLLK
jgi:hypothetical protein